MCIYSTRASNQSGVQGRGSSRTIPGIPLQTGRLHMQQRVYPEVSVAMNGAESCVSEGLASPTWEGGYLRGISNGYWRATLPYASIPWFQGFCPVSMAALQKRWHRRGASV